MRRVTLYELKQTELMAYDGQEYMQRYIMTRMPIHLPGDLMADATDKDVTVETVPVHWIRGCGRDKYIAIAPDVRTILEVPFQSKVDDLNRSWQKAVANCIELERRIDAFKALPWWERLLHAWKRAL